MADVAVPFFDNITKIRAQDNGDGSFSLSVVTEGHKGVPAYGSIAIGNVAGSIAAANPLRKRLSMANNGAGTIYIGSDGNVTVALGYPIPPGGSFMDDYTLSAWWGIVTSGTGDLRTIEVS